MPGQNKEYRTPDEAFNALRSNERRIKSMAIKQIVKNIRKLADLQTIDLSLIFCVRDEVQKRQLIKYCGHGEFLHRLKNVEPVLKQEEFVKSTSYEEFLPKVQAQPIKFVTPSKLSCGPGVSKNLAHQQKQQLEDTEVIPVENETSFTLESGERDDNEEDDEIGEPISMINETNEPELIQHIEPSTSKQKRKKGKTQQKIQAAKPKLIYDSKETNETEKDVTEEVNTDVSEPVLSEPIEQISINNQDQQGATERDDQDMPIIKAPGIKLRNFDNIPVFILLEKKKRRNTKKIDQRTPSNDHIDQDVSRDIQNDSNSQLDHDVTAEEDTETTWEINSYYAVAFEDRWYPGVVTAIEGDDKDWASIKYMHPSGENFKWPGKEDSALAHINAMLCRVNVNSLANGRLWTVANIGKIDDLYKMSQLDSVEWRVDYILSSSHLKSIDEPCVQLRLKVRDPNTDNVKPVTFTVTSDKFRILLNELKQADSLMENLSS
ncbi:COMMD4 [Mytilus coruscus]|uniref:COMMD4 n=1 Tax=Mytilus coruscus TaxID=42192 RepID=A0A6J8C2I8_MYTCO|nr:COMMD4 [Mytilus coruscus]